MSLFVDIKKKCGNFFLDVCFENNDGILGLMGASGSGKSMTLKCIAGIMKPDEGKIVLDGKVLFDSKNRINLPPQKRNIGYMFQDFALFPNMTVYQNISVTVKHDQKKVEELINKYRLDKVRNNYPQQISGGEKQRVALARIMAKEPDAIFLDEPFSSLDENLKWQLEYDLYLNLKDFEGSVIWVSHDKDEIYRNCQNICPIINGKNMEIETTKDFFMAPKSVERARIAGYRNILTFDEKNYYVDEKKIKLLSVNDKSITSIKSMHDNESILSGKVIRLVKDTMKSFAYIDYCNQTLVMELNDNQDIIEDDLIQFSVIMKLITE